MEDGGKQILSTLLRVGIGGLFVFAGVNKLLDPLEFLEELARYQLWPEAYVWKLVVWFLPTLEIVLGGSLLAGFWKREAAGLLLGLTALFTLAILLSWSRGLNISCGCFGPWKYGDSYLGWIVRDVLLMTALSLLLLEKGTVNKV